MSTDGEYQAIPPLSQLAFYFSDGCNLSCRYCSIPSHAPDDPDRQQQHAIEPTAPSFSTDTIFQAVCEAVPLGLHGVRLTGGGSAQEGEPLLYPMFDALIDWLEHNELGIAIETSGAGLTAGRAERLANLPQRSVAIGLDGADAATHDALHRLPGAFETATQAARLLSQNGLAPQIVFAVLRRNAAQIPAMVQLAESLGAESLRFVAAQPDLRVPKKGGSGHESGLSPAETLPVEELIAVGRKVEREFSRGTRLRLMFDQPPAFRGLHPMSRVDSQERCSILNSLAVLPDGSYALCGIASALAGTHPELVFGQVGKDPLEKVWIEHPMLRALRSGMPGRLQGVCNRCQMKTACLGNCAAENYLRSGTFWGPYWFCEAAEHAGLFPMGRLMVDSW